MSLNVESKIARMWAQAVCAALEGGSPAGQSVDSADHVALAYRERFGPTSEQRLGATITLRNALAVYERSALINQEVAVIGQTDTPAVGRIKDFSNGDKIYEDSAQVVWSSGGPPDTLETWMQIDKLQLIMKLGD